MSTVYQPLFVELLDLSEDINIKDINERVSKIIEKYDIQDLIDSICFEDKDFSKMIFNSFKADIIYQMATVMSFFVKDKPFDEDRCEALVKDIHRELTFTSEDDIIYTDEELKELIIKKRINDIDNLSSEEFAKFRFIIHYMNYYGISEDLKERRNNKKYILTRAIKIAVHYLKIVDEVLEEKLHKIGKEDVTGKDRLYWKIFVLVEARPVLYPLSLIKQKERFER